MNTRARNRDGAFARFQSEHAALWQFIKFALLGLVATAVELAVFALCDFLLFRGLRARPFSWWLIDYSVENGGLGAFWAFVISYAAGQITNFVIQRKYTFHARNNPALSALMYLLVILALYVFTLWLPTLLHAPLAAALGDTLGELAVKAVNMFATMLILFPVNKFVIMRGQP
ncbi:MAG: GtrA family protein [Clostridia bacterium]|nr:GtrA family protein [Clostridia bacterium]